MNTTTANVATSTNSYRCISDLSTGCAEFKYIALPFATTLPKQFFYLCCCCCCCQLESKHFEHLFFHYPTLTLWQVHTLTPSHPHTQKVYLYMFGKLKFILFFAILLAKVLFLTKTTAS